MDILDDFDEIKIGVAYRLNGKVLDSMPGERESCCHMTSCHISCHVTIFSGTVTAGGSRGRVHHHARMED